MEHIELIRLINLADTLDCRVVIYPSISVKGVLFQVYVLDEEDHVLGNGQNDSLSFACSAAIVGLEDTIRRENL